MSALQSRDSDGRLLRPIDWRANRLADAVAKRAALHGKADRRALQFIDSSRCLATYRAAILAQATHVANNCPVQVDDGAGGLKTAYRRDATPRPRTNAIVPSTTTPAKTDTWARTNPRHSKEAISAIAAAKAYPEGIHAGVNHLEEHAADNGADTVPTVSPCPEGIHAGVNHLEEHTDAMATPAASPYPEGIRAGENLLEDLTQRLEGNASPVTLFANVDVSQLIDGRAEDAAIASLPAPQRINLSGQDTDQVHRSRPSSDKQCKARRAATALKSSNAEMTKRQVEMIGARLTTSSSSTSSSTAASRMEAMRLRILAKQSSSGTTERG